MVCINLKIEAVYLCNRKEKGTFNVTLQKRGTLPTCCWFWVSKLCPTLCDPMDCSMPVPCPSLSPRVCLNSCHWVGGAIQPFHPLLPASPPALNLSQHQDFFQWVGSSCQVAKVLELLHQSFQWIFRADFLYDCQVCAPCCPRDSQESSPAPQFESISSLMLSLLCGLALTSIHDYWKNHSFDCTDRCHQSDVSAF